MILLLFLWAILFVLVLVGQSALLIWHAGPSLRRMVYCPWCWKSCHIMRWYPERWSSTICAHHEHMIRTQSATRRANYQTQLQVMEN